MRKHGSSIKPSKTEWVMLEPYLLQPCLHVAGTRGEATKRGKGNANREAPTTLEANITCMNRDVTLISPSIFWTKSCGSKITPRRDPLKTLHFRNKTLNFTNNLIVRKQANFTNNLISPMYWTTTLHLRSKTLNFPPLARRAETSQGSFWNYSGWSYSQIPLITTSTATNTFT